MPKSTEEFTVFSIGDPSDWNGKSVWNLSTDADAAVAVWYDPDNVKPWNDPRKLLEHLTDLFGQRRKYDVWIAVDKKGNPKLDPDGNPKWTLTGIPGIYPLPRSGGGGGARVDLSPLIEAVEKLTAAVETMHEDVAARLADILAQNVGAAQRSSVDATSVARSVPEQGPASGIPGDRTAPTSSARIVPPSAPKVGTGVAPSDEASSEPTATSETASAIPVAYQDALSAIPQRGRPLMWRQVLRELSISPDALPDPDSVEGAQIFDRLADLVGVKAS